MCDKDVMQPGDIIIYCSLVQEAMSDYCIPDNSNKWEPTDNKKISKD